MNKSIESTEITEIAKDESGLLLVYATHITGDGDMFDSTTCAENLSYLSDLCCADAPDAPNILGSDWQAHVDERVLHALTSKISSRAFQFILSIEAEGSENYGINISNGDIEYGTDRHGDQVNCQLGEILSIGFNDDVVPDWLNQITHQKMDIV